MRIWHSVAQSLADLGAAALVTLAESQGSSPRETGARMLVRPDGGFLGTIGGGALEWTALAEAQTLLAQPETHALRRISQALGPDLGQCCGGRVVITIERLDRADLDWVAPLAAAEADGLVSTLGSVQGPRIVRRLAAAEAPAAPQSAYAVMPDGAIRERFGAAPTPLYLFGAGHVGRSLVLTLAPLPFAITWIDSRPGGFPQHIPANTACLADPAPLRHLDAAPAGAFVAVMTHSHALDLDIVASALRAERFGYVGLIGSTTKRARFLAALRKLGLREEAIGRLVCPIGLPAIRDKAPAAIAVGVAAQLLMARDAALRHASEPVARPGEARSGVHV